MCCNLPVHYTDEDFRDTDPKLNSMQVEEPGIEPSLIQNWNSLTVPLGALKKQKAPGTGLSIQERNDVHLSIRAITG